MSDIIAAPDATFLSELDNAPTGLVGTIGVRIIRDSDQVEVLARTTKGIVESPAGSGHYTATLVAPSTAGDYSVLWDSGTVTPSTTAVDDLVVGTTFASASDLTTVEAVREFTQKRSTDTAQDAVIQMLISAASKMVSRYTERQFFPETGVKHTFEWNHVSQPMFVDFMPFELRTATAVTLDTDGSPHVLDPTEYKLWPVPNPDGTYFGIRLNPFTPPTVSIRWAPRRQVEVEGDWGMPAIPADIAFLTTLTVAIWLRRDVSAFEAGMRIDEGYVERPKSLPSAVKGGLDMYRRMG
jgi:hypothetical protein